MRPSSSQLLPLRGQIELDSLRINAPESPHDVLRVWVTLLGKLSASQSHQPAPATTKSPPELPAFAALVHPVSATARPDRARFTQNKRHRVAARCIETVGYFFWETIRLPEPPASPGHHKVTPGTACCCHLRPPGCCHCEARSSSTHARRVRQRRRSRR